MTVFDVKVVFVESHTKDKVLHTVDKMSIGVEKGANFTGPNGEIWDVVCVGLSLKGGEPQLTVHVRTRKLDQRHV